MLPGSVAEPQQWRLVVRLFLMLLFPMISHVLSHKELKCLGKEETEQVCKCLDFES